MSTIKKTRTIITVHLKIHKRLKTKFLQTETKGMYRLKVSNQPHKIIEKCRFNNNNIRDAEMQIPIKPKKDFNALLEE